jgi:segregation and condensation protein A
LGYQVKIDVYEGPFDLLLNLIAKREIDIYQVVIADITREYLAYLESMRSLDLEIATEFLLIAATLIKLKSDSLLPKPPVEVYDDFPVDSRDELIWRLVEFKKFKNAAEELERRLSFEDRYYYREVEVEEPFRDLMPDVLSGLELNQLVEAARRLTLAEVEVDVDISHIAPIRISIRDYIEKMLNALEGVEEATFVDLTGDCTNRLEVIVCFLAILELYKWDIVSVKQARRFGDIRVSRNHGITDEEVYVMYEQLSE